MSSDASSTAQILHACVEERFQVVDDRPTFCVKYCARWLIFLFTQVAGTHLRNSSRRRPFVSCACRNSFPALAATKRL